MGRGSGGVVRGVGALLGVLLAVSGCGAAEADPVALPTFPASTAATTTGGLVPDEGTIPDDCERLLKVADLNALLGLPLDTVTVRSTLGVPEPSVGRTERVACRYTTKAAGPARGRPLLDLNAAAYSTPDAALAQWRRNADVEDGEHRQLPIGSAGAVLVERGGEALLSVVYGPSTVTLVLPDQPLPGGRPRAEALVDLALRVLPAVAPPARPKADAVPASTAAGPGAGPSAVTAPATPAAAPANPRTVGSP